MNETPAAVSGLSARPTHGRAATVLPDDPAQRLRVLVGFVVMTAMAVGFAAAGPKFLNDPDTLWHVAVGKDIWLSRSFPHVDAYSHSFAGQPWIAKEWLSQIALYAAFAAGGWNGVAFLAIAVMLAVLWQVYWPLSGRLKPVVAAAITVVCLSLCSDVFVARPHILVLPFIIVFVHGVWSAAQNNRAPSFWMLAVMCVWSNMHGSFTFGFAAAFLAFLLYLHDTRDLRSPRTMRWVAFGALCPLAAMVHPYGFESIWSTVTIVESEALPYITEWRPFSATEDFKVELVILAFLAFALVSGFRTNILAALFLCLLLHMYLTHTRFTYLLFTLAPLLLVRDLAAQFPALSLSRWAESIETSPLERGLARYAPAASLGLAALVVVGAAMLFTAARWTPPGTAYPVAALNAARAQNVSGNVLNEYNFGGALIFEGEATFVDGRADRLFQDGFIPGIAASMAPDGADIVREQIKEYGIGWAILKPSDGRNAHFDAMTDWRRIYEDEFAVVHAPAP
ncbi:MAG: hypothetical protein ACX939_08835 [Hyphococcus sp.]